jgi:hypothetical protein
MPLRLIISRLLFGFQENTDFLSNRICDFSGILDQSNFRAYPRFSSRMFPFTKKTQKCKELTNVDKGIEKEMLWGKFEFGQTVYFGLSLYRIDEMLNYFDISKLVYIDVILSTKWIFPGVSTLWPSFESLLSFIVHRNVKLKLDSHWKKESMIRNMKSIYFVNTNDGTDCYRIFWNFFEEKKLESFMERKRYFWSSVFEIEMERFFGLKNGERDNYFVLKVSDFTESQIFLYSESESGNENEIIESQIFLYSESENGNENESIVSEKNEIRELLKLSGGSRSEGFSSRSGKEFTNVIRIKDSVEIVSIDDFNGWTSLKEVIFSSSNQLKEIYGFYKCTSLCRIEIPSSVEKIGYCGFFCCRSLIDFMFSSNSHLREISGFRECISLCRIEIPSSVEVIGNYSFSASLSLRVVIIHAGC